MRKKAATATLAWCGFLFLLAGIANVAHLEPWVVMIVYTASYALLVGYFYKIGWLGKRTSQKSENGQ